MIAAAHELAALFALLIGAGLVLWSPIGWVVLGTKAAAVMAGGGMYLTVRGLQ